MRYALCLLLITAGFCSAELPPYVYQQQQAKAPEALELKILSVQVRKTEDGRDTHSDVTVQARVQKVERSKTNLKPGDSIRLEYHRTVRTVPMPRPSELPLLRKGQTISAFLQRKGRTKIYVPAAGGKSFDRL